MNCNFYIEGKKECAALIALKCENCKFRKTREEYERGLLEAEANLRAKGLRAVKYYNGKNTIITTEPIYGRLSE